MEFFCQSCGHVVRAGEQAAGQAVSCPGCGNSLRVPDAPALSSASERRIALETCPMCGAHLQGQDQVCRDCGELLSIHQERQPLNPSRLNPGEAFLDAWAIYWQQPLLLSGAFFTVAVLSQLAILSGTILIDRADALHARRFDIIAMLYLTAGLLLGQFFSLGYLILILKVARGEVGSFRHLFAGGRYFLRYCGCLLAFVLLTYFGTFLCLIPGIYFSIIHFPFAFVLLDEDLPGFDSLHRARELTVGHRWSVFRMGVIMLAVVGVGVCFLGVGVLAAVPITWLMMAVGYLQLIGERSAAESE